jgi:hypothetical protein
MSGTSAAQAATNSKASRAAMRELEKRRAMQKIKMDEQLKQKQKEAVDIINKFCDEFDKDGDGDLDPGELKELLRRTSKTPPSETALSEAVAKVPSVSSTGRRLWAGSVGSWVGGRDMNMDKTPYVFRWHGIAAGNQCLQL